MVGKPLDADRLRVRDIFGVADEQIDRDHLISHLLAGLSTSPVRDRITFVGGTALSRSFLPDVRLSEDIDLIVDHRTRDVAGEIQQTLERAVARSHGRLRWNPSLTELTHGATPAVATTASGARVRVQLLSAAGYPAWPTAEFDLDQRYADAPPARLRILTEQAFVVAKTAAWLDRNTPRDLYDLWALADRNMINAAAAALYRSIGPTGSLPVRSEYPPIPDDQQWHAELGHQCRVAVAPKAAFDLVRLAWIQAAEHDQHADDCRNP